MEFIQWNSVLDFAQFGISLTVPKPYKNTANCIMTNNVPVFMIMDVINRYLYGTNVFNMYDEKYTMLMKNCQNDENELTTQINSIVNTYYSATLKDFPSKVLNKYGINWNWIVNDGKLISSLFERSSKFVNEVELNKWIHADEQVSTLMYLICWLLKDKTLKNMKEAFIEKLIAYAKMKNQKPLISFVDEIPSFEEHNEPEVDSKSSSSVLDRIEALENDKNELMSGYKQDIVTIRSEMEQLYTKVNQLISIMKLMKKDIDTLKDVDTSTSIFSEFGY